jgi:hypothetical protein
MTSRQRLTGVALTVYQALTLEFPQTHFRVTQVQETETGSIRLTLIGLKNSPSADEVYEVCHPFEELVLSQRSIAKQKEGTYP